MKKISKIKKIAKNYWTICLATLWLMRFCFAVMLALVVMLGIPFLVVKGLVWVCMLYTDTIPYWYTILSLIVTLSAFAMSFKPANRIIDLIMGEKFTDYPFDDYYIDHMD